MLYKSVWFVDAFRCLKVKLSTPLLYQISRNCSSCLPEFRSDLVLNFSVLTWSLKMQPADMQLSTSTYFQVQCFSTEIFLSYLAIIAENFFQNLLRPGSSGLVKSILCFFACFYWYGVSLFCVFFVFLVYFLLFVLSLVVSTSANYCPERLVSEMTYCVQWNVKLLNSRSSGTMFCVTCM